LRLSHIKLAGFKSFVDPTHIALPGQLVGIVGPNGCGKSNVIDALRWVLGESKASALRGESLQDVIFNGSGNRKPVSRASVELVFDNSLGKAAGQWTSYAEIAIRRVLRRDGDSSYYINNQHVRRKDVTDIFLGTGLGARAYAIIEQGMISRIIEARPEELRVFLEEAAGVSKYRDRRRETENRLADTRDNLLRLDDILRELDGQLERLADQAEVARQYRSLEQRRETVQQQLWLVRKQEAAVQRARHAEAAAQARNELEAETARLREAEAHLEEARAQHFQASDALHVRQGELYECNAEVARLEQQIGFLAAQRERIAQQIAANERLLAQQHNLLQDVGQRVAHWQQEQGLTEARRAAVEQRLAEESARLPQVESALRDAQARLTDAERSRTHSQQQVQLAENQCAHLRRAIQQLEARGARLELERQALPVPDQAAQESLAHQIDEAGAQIVALQQRQVELQAKLPELESARREQRAALTLHERTQSQTEARLTALQQLQQRLDGNRAFQGWLARHGLDDLPRLWQSLRIDAGWEDALEAVLRERLNALRVERLEAVAAWEMPPGRLSVYDDAGSRQPTAEIKGLTPLQARVSCSDAVAGAVLAEWLDAVYVAESLGAALAQRAQLPSGARYVTREGHLVDAGGVAFHAPDGEVHGLLARQREIEQLETQLAGQREQCEGMKATLAMVEQACQQVEAESLPLRSRLQEATQRQHALQLQLLKLTQSNERSRERGRQIAAELGEVEAQIRVERDALQAAEREADAARERIESGRAALQSAQSALQAADQALREQRTRSQQAEREAQEIRFYAKTCVDKLADQQQEAHRLTVSLAQIEHDVELFRAEAANSDDTEPRQALQASLARRAEFEQALAAARNGLEQAVQRLTGADHARQACERRLPDLRDRLAEWQLKEQEARVHYEQWAEHLADVDEEPLRAWLAEHPVRPAALQAELTRLGNEIAALGAVNLAALEELQSAEERREYLDAQATDLRQAMDTLEAAIRRIDRESRDLLMSTYEAVNRNLGELFPVLFGGGEAKLVLTGEEILDSGVQVMAQPPGKKNSTIHLLSGGEKALTAIALVFSLFQLNPAPFCLLDEVDAPLDDANTERLCNLIRRMSQRTQFVFISHNKLTMELAHQLVGVTMQEKGVSRVVAVDIEEALRLRDTP
jgi:chromosome segregation protein